MSRVTLKAQKDRLHFGKSRQVEFCNFCFKNHTCKNSLTIDDNKDDLPNVSQLSFFVRHPVRTIYVVHPISLNIFSEH